MSKCVVFSRRWNLIPLLLTLTVAGAQGIPDSPNNTKTWAVKCTAPGAQDVKATLYLTQLSSLKYRVAKIQYNEAGKVILENGKGLPAVKGYHDRYLKEKQEISRPAFHSMVWAWKTFGSKFQWGAVTYHCQIT